MMTPAPVEALPLIVALFGTAFPDGPAIGPMPKITWGSLAKRTGKRREGAKDGDNIVFARFTPEPDGRARRLKQNVLARTAIALDCETDKKTGEIPPSPVEVIGRVKAQGWAAIVYTSHNHSADAPRYRIILPLTAEIAPALPAVEVVADMLGLSGVLDRSKLGASSLFYLPSAEPGRSADHHTAAVDGAPIAAAWVQEHAGALLAAREIAQARLRRAAMAEAEARRAARIAAGFKPSENLIEQIRDRLDLAGEMVRHGYRQIGNKWLYPGSETGVPGVHILTGSDGVERVYSHHAADPIAADNLPSWCTVKAIDVVDLVAILDHSGDRKAALHKLAKQYGIEARRTAPVNDEPTWDDIPPPDREPRADASGIEAQPAPLLGKTEVDGFDLTEEPRLVLNPAAPLDTSREIVRRRYTMRGLRTLHHQNGTFFKSEGSHYREFAEEEVRAEIYKFLDAAKCMKDEKLLPFRPNRARVGNVLEALAAEVQLPTNKIAPTWLDGRQTPPPGELIAFSNGLLHLPTRRLIEHTPALFSMNALPFNYAAAATAPLEWLQFLHSLWPQDKEAISTLQEMFGLFLTGETRHQKAFLMVGPKRSGKGTIARVLTHILGQANVCGPTLSSISQNFGLAPLIGKRLAIISDARLSGKSDQQVIVERLLAITGEDSLTVDRKFREPWTGRLQTRFLILTNEVPKLSDSSGALASRFVVLILKNSFFGNEDHGLTDRLMAEAPGILRWALDGWERLAKRRYLIVPASSQAVQQEMEDLGSPIGAFVRERCDVAPGNWMPCDQLYNIWMDWCRDQNRDHFGTVQDFGRNLRATVPGLSVTNNRLDTGARQRRYEGIQEKSA